MGQGSSGGVEGQQGGKDSKGQGSAGARSGTKKDGGKT